MLSRTFCPTDSEGFISQYGQVCGHNPAIPERQKPFGDHFLSLKCVDCSAGDQGSQGFPPVKNWIALNKEKDNPGVGVSSSRISKSVDTWFIIPPRYVDINRIYGNVRLHGDEKSEAIAMSVAELDEHSSDMITENLLFYRMIMVKY